MCYAQFATRGAAAGGTGRGPESAGAAATSGTGHGPDSAGAAAASAHGREWASSSSNALYCGLLLLQSRQPSWVSVHCNGNHRHLGGRAVRLDESVDLYLTRGPFGFGQAFEHVKRLLVKSRVKESGFEFLIHLHYLLHRLAGHLP
jgi:hypothetical protein